MVSFSELVGTALRAATAHLLAGSRRNAREALEVRYDLRRQGFAVMAARPAARAAAAGQPPRQRSSA